MSKKKNNKHKKNKKQITKSNTENISNNKYGLKKLFLIFLLSRILMILFLIIKKDLSIFELYDSEHYINMAKYGYQNSFLYAFFPLYPILIKILKIIIPSYQITGAIISNICSFLSLLLVDKLTKEKDNSNNIICFLFSPILAFTSIVYTESLFMFLTLLGYYLYKKDKYFLSSIIVGCAILTRNSGIILWGAIGLDMLHRLIIVKDKNIKFKNIIIFGITSLLIGMIYPTYLYLETGNFLEFASVQNEYWHRESGNIITGIIKDIKVLSRCEIDDGLIINIIIFLENWLSFILIFILGIKIFKKDKVSSIYILVSLIAFQTSYRDINFWKTLSSISLFRYTFNLFPVYLYLFDNKQEITKRVIFLLFWFVSIINTIFIYSGIFMA